MQSYKWKIDRHPKGLGWIIYEWKNTKLTSWKSGNFSSEELAQARLNQRKALLMNVNQEHPSRTLSKDEIATLFGMATFPKRKQLNKRRKK